MIQSNQYSHLTAKERETLSFPAKLLLNKGLMVGDVLDFGCGFGKDIELLKALPNFDAKIFEEITGIKID